MTQPRFAVWKEILQKEINADEEAWKEYLAFLKEDMEEIKPFYRSIVKEPPNANKKKPNVETL